MADLSIAVPATAVFKHQSQIRTNSLLVAEVFGKRHRDVMKKISSLECSDDYRVRNFAQTVIERANPSGGAPIKSPIWEMTKDGFIFLVMGFTGKKAAAIKEAYIQRFNDMAEALRQPKPKKPKSLPSGLSSEQQEVLRGLVHARINELPEIDRGKAAMRCWSALKSKFGTGYKEIPPAQFTEAVSLLTRLVLAGECLPAEPMPEERQYTISEDDLILISSLCHSADWVYHQWREQGIAEGVRSINRRLYGQTFEHFDQLRLFQKRLDASLESQVVDLYQRRPMFNSIRPSGADDLQTIRQS